jgi:hypothetical protein
VSEGGKEEWKGEGDGKIKEVQGRDEEEKREREWKVENYRSPLLSPFPPTQKP